MKQSKPMSKSTKKPRIFNVLVVKKLSQDYGLSEYYIKECLKGHKSSITSETIRKKYKILTNQINEILNK